MESAPGEQPDNEVNPGEFRYGIRAGTPEDVDFIVDSWRRSYDDSPWARCPGGLREYIATQQQVIAQCMKTSVVQVAYPEAPERVESQIMGWLCHRGQVLHYVYVKAPFRRQGIGRSLVDVSLNTTRDVYLTHHVSRVGAARFFAQHIFAGGVTYNPALIFGGTP